jgi:hypothetical protein
MDNEHCKWEREQESQRGSEFNTLATKSWENCKDIVDAQRAVMSVPLIKAARRPYTDKRWEALGVTAVEVKLVMDGFV